MENLLSENLTYAARTYPSKTSQWAAYESLSRIATRLSEEGESTVAVYCCDYEIDGADLEPVVLVLYGEMPERIKEGHWCGGEEIRIEEEIVAEIRKMNFDKRLSLWVEGESISAEEYEDGIVFETGEE
jgi:hypothetical protein